MEHKQSPQLLSNPLPGKDSREKVKELLNGCLWFHGILERASSGGAIGIGGVLVRGLFPRITDIGAFIVFARDQPMPLVPLRRETRSLRVVWTPAVIRWLHFESVEESREGTGVRSVIGRTEDPFATPTPLNAELDSLLVRVFQ